LIPLLFYDNILPEPDQQPDPDVLTRSGFGSGKKVRIRIRNTVGAVPFKINEKVNFMSAILPGAGAGAAPSGQLRRKKCSSRRLRLRNTAMIKEIHYLCKFKVRRKIQKKLVIFLHIFSPGSISGSGSALRKKLDPDPQKTNADPHH